jgi:hypothetical protein
VSLGGRWLPKAELDRMIRRASDRLGGAPPDSLRAPDDKNKAAN